MSEAIPLLLLSALAAYVTTILPYIQTPIGAANFILLQNKSRPALGPTHPYHISLPEVKRSVREVDQSPLSLSMVKNE